MKKIKSILVLMMLFFVSLSFFNCQIEDESAQQTDFEKRTIALRDFEDLFNKNKGKFLKIKDKHEVLYKNSGLSINQKMIIEKESKDILKPLIDQTKKLLFAYGINEAILTEVYGDVDDSRQVLVGLAILSSEKQLLMNNAKSQRSYKMAKANPYLECAKEALGLNIGIGLLHDLGEEAIEKAVKTFLKKTAARLLGPVGLAITVAEYAWCLSNEL